MALKSFSPGKKGDDIAHAGNLQYNSKNWTINGAYEVVGEQYNAEVGYVPRKGYVRLNPSIAYSFFPKGGNILTHGPQLNTTYFFNQQIARNRSYRVVFLPY